MPNILRLVFVLILAGCMAASIPAPVFSDDAPEILVSGVGYPPVRAESSAQALLMARRAALLDAYANALRREKDAEQSTDLYFQNVAGFLRNIRVLDEAYLEDGAVFLTVAVKSQDDLAVGLTPLVRGPDGSSAAPKRIAGPSPVTLDEWMRIIARLVQFDAPSNITSVPGEAP